jgi:peroxiredoxin
MRRFIAALAAATCLTAAAQADLNVGDAAPDFTVQGFQAGEAVTLTLSEALTNGPVVAFFFPAAFTGGCNAQAASFAESIDQFEALGAQVIGLTAGNTDQLSEFSTQHCADAFPVFAVNDDIINGYESRMRPGGNWTGRITYVIDQDSTIAYHYADGSPYPHVDNSLAALREMAAAE